MGLFSLIGGLIGSGSSKKAAKKAAADQVAALNRAIDVTHNQFEETRTDLAPYRDIGAKRPARTGRPDWHERRSTAAIRHRCAEGISILPIVVPNRPGSELAERRATGGIRGGNEVRSLADFGGDTLMKTIMAQIQNLGGLAGIGSGATTATGSSAPMRPATSLASTSINRQGAGLERPWRSAASTPRTGIMSAALSIRLLRRLWERGQDREERRLASASSSAASDAGTGRLWRAPSQRSGSFPITQPTRRASSSPPPRSVKSAAWKRHSSAKWPMTDAFHNDLTTVLAHPSAQGYSSLVIKHPKFAQQLKSGWDMMDKARRRPPTSSI
jgi:hypothetical protein